MFEAEHELHPDESLGHHLGSSEHRLLQAAFLARTPEERKEYVDINHTLEKSYGRMEEIRKKAEKQRRQDGQSDPQKRNVRTWDSFKFFASPLFIAALHLYEPPLLIYQYMLDNHFQYARNLCSTLTCAMNMPTVSFPPSPLIPSQLLESYV